jgi:hypothetical protein
MTTQTQPRQVHTVQWFIAHVLFFIAFVLFAISALDAGLKWSTPMWTFGLGGFAAWALAYVFL